ncbi:MAG: hypothetical protein BJ554DRAFT_7011 [Olpidium bornovanus]|uniref:Uncharacterized protein n=1 Tax=Olpidium bornovanus TaxID=278681 RepID=A0A8H7ZWK2_9FUNG|nr:MAG: hypothetical protein BJ554DRAFT_7011 [Olpidium bornovanus]
MVDVHKWLASFSRVGFGRLRSARENLCLKTRGAGGSPARPRDASPKLSSTSEGQTAGSAGIHCRTAGARRGGTEHGGGGGAPENGARSGAWTHLTRRLSETESESGHCGTAGDHFPWQDSHWRKDDDDYGNPPAPALSAASTPQPSAEEVPANSQGAAWPPATSESGRSPHPPLQPPPRALPGGLEFVSSTVAGILSGCSAALLVAPLEELAITEEDRRFDAMGLTVRRTFSVLELGRWAGEKAEEDGQPAEPSARGGPKTRALYRVVSESSSLTLLASAPKTSSADAWIGSWKAVQRHNWSVPAHSTEDSACTKAVPFLRNTPDFLRNFPFAVRRFTSRSSRIQTRYELY